MAQVTLSVVETTPVDTTHAKTNWIPSIGSPSDTIAGSKESPDAGPQSSGLAQLTSYRLEQGDLFSTNNVDYMQHLAEGSSPQAPPGFIEDAIAMALLAAVKVPGGE